MPGNADSSVEANLGAPRLRRPNLCVVSGKESALAEFAFRRLLDAREDGATLDLGIRRPEACEDAGDMLDVGDPAWLWRGEGDGEGAQHSVRV